MSSLSEYTMRLLMNVHCPNCGNEQPETGLLNTICEQCGEGPMQDRLAEAEEMLLCESIEDDLLQRINETGSLDYLMKLETFFDQRDLYLYRGWEDAQILGPPKIDKFWVGLDLRLAKDAELKGAQRCCSDQEAQNSVKYKKLEDGSFFVRFKILRRILDKIEMKNKDDAEDQAEKESEV